MEKKPEQLKRAACWLTNAHNEFKPNIYSGDNNSEENCLTLHIQCKKG